MFLGFFVTAIPIPAAVFLGLWIAGQTVYAAMANPNLPGVAYLAHISGFARYVFIFKTHLKTQNMRGLASRTQKWLWALRAPITIFGRLYWLKICRIS